jgi:hypothetical protein
MPEPNRSQQSLTPHACYAALPQPEDRSAIGLFYFFIGAIVGALLLVILPLFIAMLGAALAIGIFIALPLILAVLILIGIVAAAPALGYGLLLAAILIALWSGERKKRWPPR